MKLTHRAPSRKGRRTGDTLSGGIRTVLVLNLRYEATDAAAGRRRVLRASVSFGLRLLVGVVAGSGLALLVHRLLP